MFAWLYRIWLMMRQQPSAPPPAPAPVVSGGTLLINDQKSIYTVNVDGSNKRLITDNGMMPSWTPDGRIIFFSDRAGSPQIYEMAEDGTAVIQLGSIPNGMVPLMPQIGRNDVIVFMASEQGGADPRYSTFVWTMRRDGFGLRKLILGNQPSLALSGTWISYTAPTGNPGHFEIWRMNIDGTGARQLTFFGEDPNYPDANASNISPDETQIAIFSGKESTGPTQDPSTWGYRNIAVIPANGGPRRTITNAKPITVGGGQFVACDNPAWSSDGKTLIFDTDKPGIWACDLNGQNVRQLNPQNRGTVRVAWK